MGKKEHIILDGKEYILKKGGPTLPHRRQPVVPWPAKRGGGDTRYSDFQVWSERAFINTHLGRGEEFDNGLDGRYFDAEQLCTRYEGWIALGFSPAWLFARTTVEGKAVREGFPLGDMLSKAQFELGREEDNPTWAIGQSFKLSAKISCAKVNAKLGWRTWEDNKELEDITGKICQDNNNKPGAEICSKKITGEDFVKAYGKGKTYLVSFEWDAPATLYQNTRYWFVLEVKKLRVNERYAVLYDKQGGYTGGECKRQKAKDGPWLSKENADIYFMCLGNLIEGGPLRKELDGEVVDFCQFDDGGGLDLYVLAGKEVYVYNPATERLVEEDAGLTGDGICMRVYKDSLYVSQGGSGAVRKKSGAGWGNVTGEWKANQMGVGPDLEGEWALWIGGLGNNKHKVRSTVDGEDFSDWIECGNASGPITYIGYYSKQVWVGKEDEIGSIDRTTKKYAPEFQFPSQQDSQNFRASCVWHKNDLMLNIRHSVWHWNMGSQFRNIGPTKGIGFPRDRRGKIGAMLPLVGRLLVAIDGAKRYSSIVSYGGVGDVSWHEEFRADTKGERIRAMFHTPAGELESNCRLWFGCGKRVGYLVMPDDTDNPIEWGEEDSNFYMQGMILYAWFDGLLRGIDKDWDSVTVGVHQISDDTFVDVLYRTVLGSNIWSEGEWKHLGTIGSAASVEAGSADVSPTKQQATLSFLPGTVSKVIQIALILRTEKAEQTPVVQMTKLKWWPEPDRVNRWILNINCIDWENTESVLRKWTTQQSDLWGSYYKKEPVLFTDIYGREWPVRFEVPPIEAPIPAARTDEPQGCEFIVYLVET